MLAVVLVPGLAIGAALASRVQMASMPEGLHELGN